MATLKNTVIDTTGALQLPVGTTAQRPTASAGHMRYNSTFKTVETYTGTRWEYMPDIVRTGLVLNLDAGEPSSYPGSGTTWTDLSGNGYVGTLVNGVGYDSSSGGSLVFDGSNDYVDLNTNNIITGTNPFTFEAFYKVTNTSVAAEIFGNYGSGYTSNTIWISGRYGVYINASVPYFQGAPIGTGTYHMAFTRTSAGACVLYKNAVVDGTATSTTSISVGLNFRIGSDVNGIGEVFGGNLYNIKVYNRALTASEVSQNYQALKGRFGL